MKVVTGLVRLSYEHLVKPAADMDGVEKYSAALLIDKNDEKCVAQIENAIDTTLRDPEVLAKWGGKSAGVDRPVRDGDKERPDDAVYAGHYFINAKAGIDRKPKLYDRDRVEIVDQDEIYSGCYGQAVLQLYPYNHKGHKGLAWGINAFRKIKDGQPLTGGTVSASDFDDDLIDADDADLI